MTNDARAPVTLTASISASPNPINELENTVLTFTMSGGTANGAYTFRITITKPSGTGQAYYDLSFNANSTGGTLQAVLCYNQLPPWTAPAGTASTDVPGTYSVIVDETSPKAVTGVATATFVVTNQLKVRIISPSQGTSFARGTTVPFIATVNDIQNNAVTSAQVSVSTPTGSIILSPTTPSGTYSGTYLIQKNDALGNWNITANAYSPSPTNNIGSYSVLASITPSQLVVSDLSTYNQFGSSTSDFSPGDTLYASFRISYSGGGPLMTGAFKIKVENPSGSAVTTLQTIYDSTRGLFYAPSGIQVSSSDPSGSWQLVFPAFTINDTFGNSGPVTTITYRFQVHQVQNPLVINPFYYLIATVAVGGGFGVIVFLKRFNSTTGPFDDLFKLTGGELRPPATLMIMSDSGAGSTTMGLQLLYRDLKRGKFCGLLSYDAFPSEITRRMRNMGWDITPYLQTGQLKILDCYSALAGVEGSLIRDPTDFTEVSIQVTGMIEKAKGPVTMLLDSVTPIFNSSAAKDCINFLQVLGAKLKNSGGIFIFTATKGSIPEEARSKIEALADGVIELNLVKKAKTLSRSLLVKKMAGGQTSPVETGFEIAQGKGILIRKQRIPIGLFRP